MVSLALCAICIHHYYFIFFRAIGCYVRRAYITRQFWQGHRVGLNNVVGFFAIMVYRRAIHGFLVQRCWLMRTIWIFNVNQWKSTNRIRAVKVSNDVAIFITTFRVIISILRIGNAAVLSVLPNSGCSICVMVEASSQDCKPIMVMKAKADRFNNFKIIFLSYKLQIIRLPWQMVAYFNLF